MSLRRYFLKNSITYRIYLYYNIYFRHKSFLNRVQYSQWGEDKVILNYFKNIDKGIYLDIGCFHPLMYSNTCLLYKKGWYGINIDINPTSIDLFKIVRPKDLNLCTTIDEKKNEYEVFFDHPFSPVNSLVKSFNENLKNEFYKKKKIKKIKSMTIDEILILAKKPKIDFLNIDSEGMDLKILKQLIPHKILPNLVSIETHQVHGTELKDGLEINNYLKVNKYKVLQRIGPTTLFNLD